MFYKNFQDTKHIKFPKRWYILCTSTKPCTPKAVQFGITCVSIFREREGEIDESTDIIKRKTFLKKVQQKVTQENLQTVLSF